MMTIQCSMSSNMAFISQTITIHTMTRALRFLNMTQVSVKRYVTIMLEFSKRYLVFVWLHLRTFQVYFAVYY